jgi:hypothetical protein
MAPSSQGLGPPAKSGAVHPLHDRKPYLRLIEAGERCPPKDVGGPSRYAELLEGIGVKKHERHAKIREWLGEKLDPKAYVPEPLKAQVAAFAKR